MFHSHSISHSIPIPFPFNSRARFMFVTNSQSWYVWSEWVYTHVARFLGGYMQVGW